MIALVNLLTCRSCSGLEGECLLTVLHCFVPVIVDCIFIQTRILIDFCAFEFVSFTINLCIA